ncbi:MAG: ATP-binding cassette domain-containing protein, partial [Spirochaetes bacterium]|nr:ATP-binding cassette domain-containing protein [Spirochaetota bacterium]
MPDIIELQNVCLSLDHITVLDNVNLVIHPAETVCIMGASGSGKTMLLKIMAGLETPKRGRVMYNRTNFYHTSEKKYLEIQKKTGFVFEDSALISNMNVFENIALPLRYHLKLKENQIIKTVESLLENFDLMDCRNHRPAILSSGKRKLVSIARAIVLDPEIIFYDNPFSHIDKISMERAFSIINSRIESKTITSVIVTTDFEFAKRIADKLVIMYDGKIIDSGTISEILASDN